MFFRQSILQNSYKDTLQKVTQETLTVIGGSLFIALCAQISIPLPFTIVPLTLQTLAVLLVSGLFGQQKGVLMVLAYLAEISVGLPVCAGGTVNALALIGPKGGYLMGFIAEAYIFGWSIERLSRFSVKKAFLGGILASTVQLILGVCFLAQFVGWQHVWIMGFIPFIPGGILKLLVAITVVKKFRT